MIIAVSQRMSWISSREEQVDSLDQRLIKILSDCDLIPVPVPNALCNADTERCGDLKKWLEVIQPQGFVLSGGADVGVDITRDLTEMFLINHAKKHSLPMLGLCRGMQLMGIWAGCKLSPLQGHVKTRHKISGEFNSEVNSFHNFALEKCPVGFRVTATSSDGHIEAFAHEALSWQGWMWHPEREKNFSKHDMAQISKIFKNNF